MPVFRLDQSALNRRDILPLRAAIEARQVIDATDLEFTAEDIHQIRGALESDSEGHHRFSHWRFERSHFGDGCDFSRCQFRISSFDDCVFEDRTSFQGAIFSRSLFRRATFGDDANFERTDFGVKADFHSASFGARPRFSHSRFQSTQFFAVVFGSEAGFAGTSFAINAHFHSSRFGPRANFTEARFSETVDFGGAYFGDKFQMMNAHFSGSPSFVGTTFGPRARLTDWHIGGNLNMRSAHFLGAVSLHGAEVRGSAIFTHASFDGFVDVGAFTVSESAYFGSIAINAADRFGPLHVADKLDLNGVIVRSACAFVLSATTIDLSDARFLAPLRIVVGGGEVLIERLENDSRLVLTTPQPVGVEYSPPRLLSVRGADLNSVVVSGFDVRSLRFEGAEGIDGLRIESGTMFEHAPRGPRAHREVIAEEHAMRQTGPKTNDGWYPPACRFRTELSRPRTDATELSRIYRGLRKAREDMRDAPGAADFYYGEMEMRRLESRKRLARWTGFGPFFLYLGTYLLLELYRIFGGYGVRPSRPLLLFSSLVLLGAGYVDCSQLIHHVLLMHGHHSPVLQEASFEEAVVFVLRSALLLPTSVSIAASTGAEWVQIGARLLGPLLVGLFAFGLRARVHR